MYSVVDQKLNFSLKDPKMHKQGPKTRSNILNHKVENFIPQMVCKDDDEVGSLSFTPIDESSVTFYFFQKFKRRY